MTASHMPLGRVQTMDHNTRQIHKGGPSKTVVSRISGPLTEKTQDRTHQSKDRDKNTQSLRVGRQDSTDQPGNWQIFISHYDDDNVMIK